MTNTKIVFVAIYFGKLPDHFQLWLNSCAVNKNFTWLLITDSLVENYSVPDNVIFKNSNLKFIKKLLSEKLNIDIALDSAYKLCDYRPVYWLILDEFKIKYNFWGNCDIDLIFGRLDKFITKELLSNNDRIFGLGHLSLMRQCPLAKIAFSLECSAPSWKAIFKNPKNIGFDEHHGINRVWNEFPLLFHEDESIVADIDPQFKFFRLTNLNLNKSLQIFYMENNLIFQGSFNKFGCWEIREYAYIHFQKRHMPMRPNVLNASRILIDNNGLTSLPELPKNETELIKLLGGTLSMSNKEKIASFKTAIRYKKREFFSVFKN